MREEKPEDPKGDDPGGRPPQATKKEYRAPRLIEYGNLKSIVMAKRGRRNDGGGKPKTKM